MHGSIKEILMQRAAALILCLVLGACASAPAPDQTTRLLHDQLFQPPSKPVNADDVFALSSEMRHYISTEMSTQLRVNGRRRWLLDALYSKNRLQLEFDSDMTRNAAEAFAARSGNCLSLVIMTAAFAREIGLSVRYQNVLVDETWSRSGDNYMAIGHVNLVLGEQRRDVGVGATDDDLLLVDFLPAKEARKLRSQVIGQDTVLAMYMNNRAAELLAQGKLDDAYWHTREAIRQDPGFMYAYNTLGAVYQRHRNLEQAEQVFTFALSKQPDYTEVMSNLVAVLGDLGRISDARALSNRLRQLEPFPPFMFFKEGLVAMRNQDYKTATVLFAKEVERAPYYHEFHFWLAEAYAGSGDLGQARRHLTLAMETSTTRRDHDLYAAKLAQIEQAPEGPAATVLGAPPQ
jgi:Tfp pilus assembly protein PilF